MTLGLMLRRRCHLARGVLAAGTLISSGAAWAQGPATADTRIVSATERGNAATVLTLL